MRPIYLSRSQQLLLILSFTVLAFHPPCAESLPLSTSGRWIVDAASGLRVKLHCINWAAHLPPVLPEGLDRQPAEAIAVTVASLGFNCLRLTWATHVWTGERYANLTATASLQSLGLYEAAAGLARNNPRIAGMTVREAFEAVVTAAARAGLMLVLDNHVSRPQWCCGEDDGNGFFGDAEFGTEEWLRGLEAVAVRFRGVPQVIGVSLRNELRGRRANVSIWRKNMARGCEIIHKANPNLLVVVSGLSYDTDLSFLRKRRLSLSFRGKLVHEIHTYAFSGGHRKDWAERPLAPMCAGMAREFDERAGFLIRGSAAVPLFVSEFGGDQTGVSRSDNRFLSCFLAMAADLDLDWALWALQGSYYIRKGQPNSEETFGVLNSDWSGPKSPRFGERYRLQQELLQGPGSSIMLSNKIIYHPSSGLCLSLNETEEAQLTDCRNKSRWSYEPKQIGAPAPISPEGTNKKAYAQITGDGLPVTMTTNEYSASQWSVRSVSGLPFQIVGKYAERDLCLESDYPKSTVVITKECTLLEGPTDLSDPRPQWFVFI